MACDAVPELRRGKLQRQLYKTRLCTHYEAGSCRYGATCVFAHNPRDILDTPDLRKTRLCKQFMVGNCSEPDCTFAHGESELRSFDWFYKKSLCAWFDKGACVNGSQCRFAHGVHEIRKPPMRKLDRDDSSRKVFSNFDWGESEASDRLEHSFLSRELQERESIAEQRALELARNSPEPSDLRGLQEARQSQQMVVASKQLASAARLETVPPPPPGPPTSVSRVPQPGLVPIPSSLLEVNGSEENAPSHLADFRDCPERRNSLHGSHPLSDREMGFGQRKSLLQGGSRLLDMDVWEQDRNGTRNDTTWMPAPPRSNNYTSPNAEPGYTDYRSFTL
jgi:hypothetical protein